MKKDFIEKAKEKMLAKKDELVTSISDRNAEVTELTSGSEPGDEIDVASYAVDGNLLNQLGARDAELLNQINSALSRINQGTYGICLDCGQQIPEPRLTYIPWAAYCVDCQSKHDRQDH